MSVPPANRPRPFDGLPRRCGASSLLALALTVACGDRAPGRGFIPDDVTEGVASLGPATHFELGTDDPADLEWDPCPLRSGGSGSSAECVTVSVPLVRDSLGEPYIELFVKRWPAAEPSRGQLWLLQGGPGISGVSLEDLAELVTRSVRDLDVYIPDHRGTGRSQLFECRATLRGADQELTDALRSCAEEIDVAWGQSARGFRTSEAARDVIDMIEATRLDDQQVFIHGGSYGGYWLHRILQLAPDVATAAIFESSAAPRGQQSTVDLLLDREQAGHNLLEACARDELCSSRLGSDPVTQAREIIAGADDCDTLADAGIDSEVLSLLMTEALLFAPTRSLVPALLARARACTPDDTRFLVDFFTAAEEAIVDEPEPPDPSVSDSIALLFQINLSELHTQGVDDGTLRQAAREALFPETQLALALNDALTFWPVYDTQEPEGRIAEVDHPVLVLHGTFDPRTGVAIGRDLAAAYAAPRQYYFEFPNVGHGVVYGSHDTGNGTTCGEAVLRQFLTDPLERPDGSCIDQSPLPDFRGAPDVLENLSGQREAWPEP